jgi:hypothetical protein
MKGLNGTHTMMVVAACAIALAVMVATRAGSETPI